MKLIEFRLTNGLLVAINPNFIEAVVELADRSATCISMAGSRESFIVVGDYVRVTQIILEAGGSEESYLSPFQAAVLAGHRAK